MRFGTQVSTLLPSLETYRHTDEAVVDAFVRAKATPVGPEREVFEAVVVMMQAKILAEFMPTQVDAERKKHYLIAAERVAHRILTEMASM